MGLTLGVPKVKKGILGKSKMAATATIVPQRKKFRKQKKLVSMRIHLKCAKIFDLR